MKRFWRVLFLAAFMIMHGGCDTATKPIQMSSSELPSWFVNPPSDNHNSYFGAGEGWTKRDAQNRALEQISSRIALMAKSIMQANQRSNRVRQAHSDLESIRIVRERKIEVIAKNSELSMFDVINTAHINNRFYTLIKMDREELFNDYHGRLIRLDGKIAQKHTSASRQPLFKQIVLLEAIDTDIENAVVKFPLLKSINPAFDEKSFYAYYDEMEAEKVMLKKRLIIGFKKTKVTAMKEVLKKHLLQEGIATVSDLNDALKKNPQDVAIIAIGQSAQEFKMTDAYLAKVTIKLTVYNYKEKILSQNRIQVDNTSKKSFSDAAEKTEKFDQLAVEQGIMTLLGGKQKE